MDNQNSPPKAVARTWFLTTALSMLGVPYLWGGNTPRGVDCSGLVVEALKAAGIIDNAQDLTADGLWNLVKGRPLRRPRAGALMFVLDEQQRARHVIICLDEWYGIAASGGGRKVSSTDAAWDVGAFVKIRPLPPLQNYPCIGDPFG